MSLLTSFTYKTAHLTVVHGWPDGWVDGLTMGGQVAGYPWDTPPVPYTPGYTTDQPGPLPPYTRQRAVHGHCHGQPT